MNISNSKLLIIPEIINKLDRLTRIDVQSNWYYCDRDLPITTDDRKKQYCSTTIFFELESAQLNDKSYITWSAGRQTKWLIQKFIIPESLQNYPLQGLSLRLALTWWAEDAQIFVNGQLVQQGDLFDSSARILLTRSAIPKQEITVAIRLVSPGHDIGALMRSKLIYERDNAIDPGFVADELTVLHNYLENFEPDKLERFAKELDRIDWNSVANAEKFDRSISNLRQNLLPLAENIEQRSLNLLGHAHLDMAWLWTSDEAYEVGRRTFASVINLQKDFPYLTFCHSTPALYAWIEKNHPELFTQIKLAIERGKWEVVGGMWVEPEVNIISGESLVRQLYYGQKYCLEKFGEIAKVAWLPDSFGFTWQLPQIFKQAEIEYFVTGKLHWNDTNPFPHGCFWWRSPDGTEIFTLMSPPNLTGVMDTNPITMTNYAISWEKQTGLQDAFWLPGIGDHGGGPTRDMLEIQEKWQHSPFFPRIEFTTAIDYLERIGSREQVHSSEETSELSSAFEGVESRESGRGKALPCPYRNRESEIGKRFPIWDGELYLELHRGCYTTHADRKRFNRYCEGLLYRAELFAAIATVVNDSNDRTWQEKIDEAWQKVLFNQFHDILPGTSIREVFIEADELDREAIAIAEEVLEESLQAIVDRIQLPPPPKPEAIAIFIFNSLNWKRSELVSLSEIGEIYDLDGKLLFTQIIDEERRSGGAEENTLCLNYTTDNKKQKLLFLAENVPSVGYRIFWLVEKEFPLLDSYPHSRARTPNPLNSSFKPILENEYLKVIINSQTGNLDSIFDKINNREILRGAGNQLQAFQDKGQYWDAWNIDPNYQQHPLPPTELKSIQWLDDGILQQRIRVIRQLNRSEFIQDYILQINSSVLQISTTVDWQEEYVLVKAAFPLNLESEFTTYEIPCGAIERPHNSEIPQQKAKWEVCAMNWADLSDRERNYGVSLLNDCKYGYDSNQNTLRLTLLRSSRWPDPEADKGIHQFTYAIYPHTNTWRSADTVRKGYELNIPLILFKEVIERRTSTGVEVQRSGGEALVLSSMMKFLDLDANNLVLMSLKLSNLENCLIMRCYECHGETANLNIKNTLNLTVGDRLNFLEQSLPDRDLVIKPWQIASFKLSNL
jgi:alpha-mannosidase